MDKKFIFDYDDTLAWNHHDYSFAQIKFVEWVIGRLGPAKAPDAQAIINLQVDLDMKDVAEAGFSMGRFPSSMRESYRVMCEGLGIEDQEGLGIAYQIGMSVFDEEQYKRRGLVEGASETLDFLVAHGDELVLLTKGDEVVQMRKISATNCRHWFGDNIHIVPRKNPEVVHEVVGDSDKSRVWHVGNGIKSDVIPGLDAGVKMIYIPRETWAYERDHDGMPDSPNLIVMEKIIDIKEKYHLL